MSSRHGAQWKQSRYPPRRTQARSSAAPVGGYYYRPPPHHHRHPHREAPIHHDVAYNWGTWLILLGLLAILVTYIVLVFTVPVQYTHTAKGGTDTSFKNRGPLGVGPLSRLLDSNKRHKDRCHVGESFDESLSMCAPKINVPSALDNDIMDPGVPACDSFFHSMCGKWIDQHENENRAFTYGYRKNAERVRDMITSPASGPVHDFYRSCVDTLVDNSRKGHKESVIEQKHALGELLGGLRLHADLPTVFGRLARAGYTAPFALSIERHPTKNELVPLFMWDGFDPSSRDGSFNETVATAIYERASDVTGHTQWEVRERVKRLMRITTQLATHNTSPLSMVTDYVSYVRGEGSRRLSEDMIVADQLPKWKALADKYRGRCKTCVDEGWNRFFQAMDGQGLRFEPEHPVWMVDKAYFHWLMSDGLTRFDMKEWQAFVEFSVLYNSHQFAPNLPSDVYFRRHDLKGPVGPGGRLHHRLPRANHAVVELRQEDCVRVTHAMVPGLVAKHFLDEFFPHKDEIRAEVTHMVRGIISALVSLVQGTPWMDDTTKEGTIEKLRAIKVRVAEPDSWIPEPFANRISPERWDHNMNMVRRYRVQQNLGLWHKDKPQELDRSAIAFFALPLMSTNAYYSGPSNTITVLTGVLQHPFYNKDYDVVSKYAILGAILGHELTHSVDNSGVLFDKDGRLPPRGWWSTASANELQARIQCIINEYGTPEGCEEVNNQYGETTIGEDMADIIGLSLAYKALFEQSAEGRALQMQHKQHFFMIFSQLWCENYDQKHKCARVASDEHAIAEYRVDKTLREMDAFQTAFGCHAGQGMFKAKDKQCVIYGPDEKEK